MKPSRRAWIAPSAAPQPIIRRSEVLTGGEASDDGDAFCYTNTVMQTSAAAIRADDRLQVEHFGPVTLFVLCDDGDDLRATVAALEGNLTTTVHAEASELADIGELLHQLREKAGRVIWNGFPTGVAVVHAMQHGGPYPGHDRAGHDLVGMNASTASCAPSLSRMCRTRCCRRRCKTPIRWGSCAWWMGCIRMGLV